MATIGRYQLLDPISEDGLAAVYRARDPVLQQDVVLKVLLPHLVHRAKVREHFLAEARARVALRHPNIVRLFDIDIDDSTGRPYYTTEFIEGPTLAQIAELGTPLPADHALRFIRQVAEAVDYLHQHNTLHCDIKASNIVLTTANQVVLTDVGVAHDVHATDRPTFEAGRDTTPYTAPVQARGEMVGPTADIHALGVLAYHLLAGRPPVADDAALLSCGETEHAPIPLQVLRPGLAPSVYTAVQVALAGGTAARPSSMTLWTEKLADLAGLAATLDPSLAAPRTERTGTRSKLASARSGWRRLIPAVTGGLGAIVLVCALVAVQNRDGQDPTGRMEPAGSSRVTVSPTEDLPASQPAAAVTTVAGFGIPGYAEGSAAFARFQRPGAVVVDRAGNLFVADGGRIRRISTDGIVTTFAGSGKSGYADGHGEAAQFAGPSALCIDADDNIL